MLIMVSLWGRRVAGVLPVDRLALISDIHGNCVALDAVLADMADQHVSDLVCLGDIASGGPQPGKVIGRLRQLGCPAVRGNGESWLLDGFPPGRSEQTRRLAEVVRWASEELAASELGYLAALPTTRTAKIGSLTLFCFHGSPRSEVESLLATTSDGDLDEAFAGVPAAARVLVGGHTHRQLLRSFGDRLLVNPGSVGLPLGSLTGPHRLPERAEYAIIQVKDCDIEIAFRCLGVDVDAVAAATARMPHATWADDLERRIGAWNARTRYPPSSSGSA